MMTRILFLILLSVSAMAQQAGILSGKVTDAANHEVLPGVTIQLIQHPNKGTVSDTNGNYSLMLDTGYYKATTHFLGYLPDTFVVHIEINKTSTHLITLMVADKMLETIVISSGKFDQRLEELTETTTDNKQKYHHHRNGTGTGSWTYHY
jgi:CarboxypepD_reg-like domain